MAAAEPEDAVLAAVHAHLHAFNARDLDAVMGLFTDDAVFATGEDLLVGRRAIRALFTDAFAAPLQARLELRSAVVQGRTAACELVEHLTLGGVTQPVALAAFYTVHEDRLARVKVYREGSAAVPPGPGSA